MQNRVIELESEKVATEEKEKQLAVLEGQNASLIASLKDAREQKTDV